MFCSLHWLDITLAHRFTTTHSPVLSPLTHINYHRISHLAIPHTHKISDLAILPTLIIINNTMPSRKDTIETMPTMKAPRKETGRLPKKSYVASLVFAAKRDHVVTVPSPHQRKGQTTRQLPLLPHAIRYASCIQKDYSNPTLNTEAMRWEQLLLYLPNKQYPTANHDRC